MFPGPKAPRPDSETGLYFLALLPVLRARSRVGDLRAVLPFARRASNSLTSRFPSFRSATKDPRFLPAGIEFPASQ